MRWNETALTKRLGIQYPIIQAPMAGGGSSPDLVAAVSNAGGLGMLAGGMLSAEQLTAGIEQARAKTTKPFGVNLLLVEEQTIDPAQVDRAHRAMQGIRDELGIETLPTLPAPPVPPDAAMEIIVNARPAVFSFTFRMLPATWISRLHDAGIAVIGTATSVDEAVALEEAGIDAVVAQGSEAGGHRGTFLGSCEDSLVGTTALVPETRDAVRIPVIAAGGIMDSRGIRSALALGADAVQMGTAFLATPESGVSPAYKRALLAAKHDSTILTRTYTGRMARGVRNRFMDEMRPFEPDLPPYPIQNALTLDIRQAAARLGNADLLPLWAGQGVALIQDRPAAELIAQWVRELDS
jgi:nitronate monooxygenase